MGTIGCGRRPCLVCKRKVCTLVFRSHAMCLHVWVERMAYCFFLAPESSHIGPLHEERLAIRTA